MDAQAIALLAVVIGLLSVVFSLRRQGMNGNGFRSTTNRVAELEAEVGRLNARVSHLSSLNETIVSMNGDLSHKLERAQAVRWRSPASRATS